MDEATAQSARIYCVQCGRPFPIDDVMLFGKSYVCAECKPAFLQRLREGETAVASLNYASFGMRFLALLIDSVVLFVASLLVRFLFGTPQSELPPAGISAQLLTLATLVNLVIGFAYYVTLLTAYGATLGKMAVGIKIVTAEGGPLSFGRATGRYFCQNYLEIFTLGIGYLIALFDDQNRTLHDRICGTRAITTR